MALKNVHLIRRTLYIYQTNYCFHRSQELHYYIIQQNNHSILIFKSNRKCKTRNNLKLHASDFVRRLVF